MYGGALVWLWAFELSVAIKLLVSVFILGGFIFHQRQYVLRKGKRSVYGLLWDSDDAWSLRIASGEEVKASLLGSSFVCPWLIILNFKPEEGGRMWPVIIMPDSTDSTSFRRLISRLKCLSGIFSTKITTINKI